MEAAPKLPPRRGPVVEDDAAAAAVPRVPPKPKPKKKKKESKRASGRPAPKTRTVKRPALQPVPEDAPVEPLPPVQRVKAILRTRIGGSDGQKNRSFYILILRFREGGERQSAPVESDVAPLPIRSPH